MAGELTEQIQWDKKISRNFKAPLVDYDAVMKASQEINSQIDPRVQDELDWLEDDSEDFIDEDMDMNEIIAGMEYYDEEVAEIMEDENVSVDIDILPRPPSRSRLNYMDLSNRNDSENFDSQTDDLKIPRKKSKIWRTTSFMSLKEDVYNQPQLIKRCDSLESSPLVSYKMKSLSTEFNTNDPNVIIDHKIVAENSNLVTKYLVGSVWINAIEADAFQLQEYHKNNPELIGMEDKFGLKQIPQFDGAFENRASTKRKHSNIIENIKKVY
jgi:hypothetical protein